MPHSADKKRNTDWPVQIADDERDLEKLKQGLRKLVSYYRDKLTKAEMALAGLEGRPQPPVEPRLNKAIKDLLARTGAQKREEIKAELLRAGVIHENKTDNSRVDRSLRQCVNAKTLVERDGKFDVPASSRK